MAVPKKKRYREVVKTRRSLQKKNLILKKNITITKFNNYASISEPYNLHFNELFQTVYCNTCKNDKINNKLCASCYVDCFLNLYHKKKVIKNRKRRIQKNINRFYYELSKTLFSPGRP